MEMIKKTNVDEDELITHGEVETQSEVKEV